MESGGWDWHPPPGCYDARALRSVHLTLLLALGMASCAVGVDSATDPLGTGDAGGKHEAGALDGAASDTGSGPADTGSSFDGGTSDTGSGAGETGTPADTGTKADTGGAKDAVADTTPPSDSGCVGQGTSGVLVTFDLSTQTGSEASVTASTTAGGLGGATLSRAPALTATSGSGSMNSSGWPTTASANASDYYTFTVTPATGCTVTLTSLAVDVQASGTGPTKGDVATSSDSFATHTASFAGTSKTTATLSASGASPLEVRVYGYGASGSAGTFRIQNSLTLSGSIH